MKKLNILKVGEGVYGKDQVDTVQNDGTSEVYATERVGGRVAH